MNINNGVGSSGYECDAFLKKRLGFVRKHFINIVVCSKEGNNLIN